MKTIKTISKYVSWLTGSEMHVESKNWISELSFIKNEQSFFDNLIKTYTLQLINAKYFSSNRDIIRELSDLQNKNSELLNAVINHEKELQVMVDEINQPKEENLYRLEHGNLIEKIQQYLFEYKKLKKEIFHMISSVMKKEKQKHLLE